jgi:hypothetical protein
MVPEGRATALVLVTSHFVPSLRSEARARRAVRDAFLVLAALALLGAQVLSTLHFALVPHHLCAVHGVLEDGGTRAEPGAKASTPSTASVEVSAPGEQDEHDACSVATRSEPGVLLPRPALERAPLTDGPAVRASAGVALKPTRTALLSCAPKTSPPVRA